MQLLNNLIISNGVTKNALWYSLWLWG